LVDERRMNADAPTRPRPRAAGSTFICVHPAIGDPSFGAARGTRPSCSAIVSICGQTKRRLPQAVSLPGYIDRLSGKLPDVDGRDKPGHDGKRLYSL
jgi:hypothetical protein